MDPLSEGTKGLPCAEELKQVSEPSPPYVLVLLLPSRCVCLPACRSVGRWACLPVLIATHSSCLNSCCTHSRKTLSFTQVGTLWETTKFCHKCKQVRETPLRNAL